MFTTCVSLELIEINFDQKIRSDGSGPSAAHSADNGRATCSSGLRSAGWANSTDRRRGPHEDGGERVAAEDALAGAALDQPAEDRRGGDAPERRPDGVEEAIVSARISMGKVSLTVKYAELAAVDATKKTSIQPIVWVAALKRPCSNAMPTASRSRQAPPLKAM